MSLDWLQGVRHHLHLDCHLPDWPEGALADFDAEQWVRNFERAGFDLVALFAKCHFGNAYYFTEHGNRHPALPRDMLAETLAACHGRGIRGLAYYSLCTDYRAATAHPEWRALRADGTPLDDMALFGPKLCPRTGYGADLVLPQLEELLQGYEVDGLFLDIPLNSNRREGCFCEVCRQRFEETFGKPLTDSATADELREHSERATLELLQQVRERVNALRPQCALVTNRAWRLGTLREWSVLCDLGVMESQPIHAGYNSHSLRTRHARTLPVPVQVMTVRFFSGWGDMTLKPVEQQKYEYSLMVAHGGVVSTGDQVEVRGALQEAAYDRFQEALHFIAERESCLEGAQSVRHGAVLVHAHEDRLTPPLLAAERALSECHAQFDVLEEADLAQLTDYRWLVLPETPRLRPDSVAALTDWVTAGGRLLATGPAGGLTDDFVLGDLLGVEFQQEAPYSLGHLVPEPIHFPSLPEIPLLVKSRLLEVLPTTAEPVMNWRYPLAEPNPPETTFRSPFPPPGEWCFYPAVTVRRVGEGLAVYAAANLFEEYQRHNHHWIRQVIEALWGLVDPAPPYEIDGPTRLQSNLMARQGRLYLNLVNFSANTPGAGRYEPIERIPDLAHIGVTLRANAKAVTLLPANRPLGFSVESDLTEIVIPRLGLFDIVEVRV